MQEPNRQTKKPDTLRLELSPTSRNGQATVTAWLAGEQLAREIFDLSEPAARVRFAATLAKGHPGIDPKAVVAELEKAAAELPPPYVPFPVEVLPEPVRSFVNVAAKALGCALAYIALPLLAALASAVGNTRRIRLKRSWCEPCVIWTVCVGESGTLKSPAFELALRPVRALQSTALREWQQAMEVYQTDKATFEADLAEWKKRGRKAGEPPPDEPEEPRAVRYVCQDTTVEALAVLLEDQPRGLLMARDELSGWVNSFDAYKSCRGADVAHWLSIYRAGQVVWDRKTGVRKVIHVPRAAVCVAGGVQPRALEAALVGRYHSSRIDEAMDKPAREHFDNGLAARLLFAMPPRLPKRWTEDDLPQATEAALQDLFGRLLALDFDPNEEEPTPIDLPLTPGAKAAWVRFCNEHARETSAMPGDLAAAWSKLEGYAARFALLVHLIRVVSGEAVDHAAVDAQSIRAGVALSRWFGNEAGRVYEILGADVETAEARQQRELCRLIRERGGRITARELMQASRRYRADTQKAEAALAGLVEAGMGSWTYDDHGGGPGRPVTVFVLSEGGNGNTKAQTPEENAIPLPLPPENSRESEVVEWTG